MRSIKFILIFVVVIFAVGACSDDDAVNGTGPGLTPPENAVGFVGDAGLSHEVMFLLWKPGGCGCGVAGYNVYRKIASSQYAKLNDAPLTEMPFGPTPEHPTTWGYVDTTFDVSSNERWEYYVTTLSNSGGESKPSEIVSTVPADVLPYDEIVEVHPSDQTDVALVPQFSWTAVPGAESYLLYLQDGSQGSGGPTMWVYRHTSSTAEVLMGDNAGVSYIDELPDSLLVGTQYFWGLWALNGQNCAIAARDTKFTTAGGRFVRLLVDKISPAGYHCVTWDQKDESGNSVSPGAYKAVMTIDQINVTKAFGISVGISPVNATCDPPSGTPGSMTMILPSTEWLLGEPVLLVYGLPSQAQVRVEIERDIPETTAH